MASGPWHYQEAEKLLAAAEECPLRHEGGSPDAEVLAAEAQVHATLALAAATALGGHLADPQFRKPLYLDEWERVAGIGPGGQRGASMNAGPSFSCGPGDVTPLWGLLEGWRGDRP